jgi:asparagine synthase (glutamine-hydrolysing)
MPIGQVVDRLPVAECDPALTARGALEQAVLPGLMSAPCMVDFSGGRDSSIVLATATHVARREGLPLPIPSTNRFPALPDTDESAWQEIVIRHLGLGDWQRRTFGDELELLGPIAKNVMTRHGLVAPAAAYVALPALREARGGASLTGIDGDGLFDSWRYQRAWDAFRGRVRPEPRDLLRVSKAAMPRRIKARWMRRRESIGVTWLSPEAKAGVDTAWANWWAGEPAAWSRRVVWWSQSRLVRVVRDAIGLLARDAGTAVMHPLLDPTFLAALSRAGGRSGVGDRTRAMHQLFGGLLPAEVLSRSDKADFTRGYFGPETRQFAASWSGQGLPTDLVDPDALRDTWRSEMPDMRSSLLVQAAWLATSAGGDLDHSFNCRLE